MLCLSSTHGLITPLCKYPMRDGVWGFLFLPVRDKTPEDTPNGL